MTRKRVLVSWQLVSTALAVRLSFPIFREGALTSLLLVELLGSLPEFNAIWLQRKSKNMSLVAQS